MTDQNQPREVNSYISDYIKFADAKAGAAVTLISLVGTALGVAAPTVLDSAKSLHAVVFVLGVAMCSLCGFSVFMVLWHALAAISPRVVPAGESLASFPDIAKLDPKTYVERAVNAPPTDVARQYAVHNATLARVAAAKFSELSTALGWARCALLSGFAVVTLYAVSGIVR